MSYSWRYNVSHSEACMRPARIASALIVPLALLLAPPAASADKLPERSQRVVSYDISVRLNPSTKQLEGRETVTWRNPSTDTVSDLWLHLYLNAFKNTSSTFIRESGGQLRGDRMSENGWGWIDVTSFRLAGGADLTGSIRFEHPDDDNADDRTVVRVPLPQPVAPSGSVTFEVAFKAQLPEVSARSGYKRNFYLVGQWFPKLGVYEPAGMRGRAAGGWNCHQYHANSEFYADYGEFHVEMTVPSNFILGATGERKGRIDHKNGTVTYIYEQADVHDFAWTADPSYVHVRRVFSGSRDVKPAEYARAANRLGRTREELQLTDVEINLLVQPAHMPQAERYVQSAKAAIKDFGLWYGRYPYHTLTVVDPPQDASGAGGMEYPTFITAGTSYLGNFWPFNGLRDSEGVTVHEFGHQFWYGMVANNEFEEAWLDEGITTYTTGLVMEAEYGTHTSNGRFLALNMDEIDMLRATVASFGRSKDAIVKPAWMYTGDYAYYAYMKPAAALRTLQGYLGDRTMARVMRTFQERWRFRHPASTDFFAVANEVSGQDLGWFFRQAFLGSDVLDYGVETVSTRPAEPSRGVVDSEGKRRTVGDKAVGNGKTPVQYESRVLVRRLGEVTFPVQIALKFEGKPVERVAWDGVDRWKRIVVVRRERLEWASVDPDSVVILDVNWVNNARRVEPDARLATWWSARWLSGLQQLVSFFGM
jgi:hypothetical protein